MKKRNTRTLMLNADYTPLGIISWKRAVVLSVINQGNPKEGVQVVDFYKNDYVQGVRGKKYPIPAVVVRAQYVRRKRRVKFSRKNVFLRDGMTCQYCGKRFPLDELTYDHVVPRAKWKRQNHNGKTPTDWKNIVTSCIKCNRKKDNKTPKEAKMHLLREPQEPNPKNYVLGLTPWTRIPKEWVLYLPKMYKDLIHEPIRS